MKGITLMGRKMVIASSNGQMELITMDNSVIITLKEKEYILGLMEDTIKGIGITIKCMELGSLAGQMVADMMAHILKIESKVSVFSNGLMAKNTSAIGTMVNNMVGVHMSCPLV
jgi:hypothetical protein